MSDVLFPELEPPAKVLTSWVAFDSDGFPCAFGDPEFFSLAQFAKEMGKEAVRVERVEGAERARLLAIHCGGSPT